MFVKEQIGKFKQFHLHPQSVPVLLGVVQPDIQKVPVGAGSFLQVFTDVFVEEHAVSDVGVAVCS